MVGVARAGAPVQQDDESIFFRYVTCVPFLLSITGFIILVTSDPNDTMFTVGFILFCSPFILLGLSCVIVTLGVLLRGLMLGVNTIARGMNGSYLNVVAGLSTIIIILLEVLALGDIVLNCADMFPIIICSVLFVGMIMVILFSILDAIKVICLKRWGVISTATVHERRRHYSENDNGGGTYTHEVLVSYEVEALLHWSCWRPFRYHAVAPPTTEPVSTGVVTVTCEETNGALHSIDMGRPIQPGLELEKTDDYGIWSSKRRIQTWLSVNESQYDSSNDSLEVAALTSWPQVAISTEKLSQYQPCEHIIPIVFLTVFAIVWSKFGVFMPREMFFGDECGNTCTSWHEKTSYILVSMLPCWLILVMVTRELGSNDSNESSQELSIVQQSETDTETVDTDDDIESDLHFEEEDSLPRIT